MSLSISSQNCSIFTVQLGCSNHSSASPRSTSNSEDSVFAFNLVTASLSSFPAGLPPPSLSRSRCLSPCHETKRHPNCSVNATPCCSEHARSRQSSASKTDPVFPKKSDQHVSCQGFLTAGCNHDHPFDNHHFAVRTIRQADSLKKKPIKRRKQSDASKLLDIFLS